MAFPETPAGDIMTLRCTHIRVDLRLAKIPRALKPSHASVLSLHPTPPPARRGQLQRQFGPPLLSGEEKRRFPFPLQAKVIEIKKVLRPVLMSICQNYTPNCFKCAPSAIWQSANNQKVQKKKRLAVQMQPIHPTSSPSVGFELLQN